MCTCTCSYAYIFRRWIAGCLASELFNWHGDVDIIILYYQPDSFTGAPQWDHISATYECPDSSLDCKSVRYYTIIN